MHPDPFTSIDIHIHCIKIFKAYTQDSIKQRLSTKMTNSAQGNFFGRQFIAELHST